VIVYVLNYNPHLYQALFKYFIFFFIQKEYFIGKFALQRQKDQGIIKKLVMFILDDLDPDKDIWSWGLEPIYRNGKFIGTVTSAG